MVIPWRCTKSKSEEVARQQALYARFALPDGTEATGATYVGGYARAAG